MPSPVGARIAQLHKGAVEDGIVTCPWHGSTFDLDTGEVVRGPATTPQPTYETRTRKGKIRGATGSGDVSGLDGRPRDARNGGTR